jgi:hypothetical protein
MKKWHHLVFAGVCATVLVVLLRAPDVTTSRLPKDATHEDRRSYERCPACHGPGTDVPVPEDHVAAAGGIRPDHVKCYFCHKPQDS